jgi:hypothetical protein
MADLLRFMLQNRAVVPAPPAAPPAALHTPAPQHAPLTRKRIFAEKPKAKVARQYLQDMADRLCADSDEEDEEA